MTLSGIFQKHAHDVNAPVAAAKRTVLHLAALEGNIDIARMALSAGAYIDAQDADGQTPLTLAIGTKNRAFCRFLLEAGASASPLCDDGRDDALHMAARLDCASIIADIVALGHGRLLQRKTGADGQTPLLHAVQAGAYEAAACLLECGALANVADANGLLPLTVAAEAGDLRMARLLVVHGHADVNAATNPLAPLRALNCAINANETEMARTLITLGADPLLTEAGCPMPLVSAAWKGNAQIVRHLLEEIPQPEKDTPSLTLALSRAIYESMAYGHRDVALYLIGCGRANLDLPPYNGTPLVMAAVVFNNTDALKALLDAGAAPDKKDAQNMTALDLARRMGKADACTLLQNALTRARGESSPRAAQPRPRPPQP